MIAFAVWPSTTRLRTLRAPAGYGYTPQEHALVEELVRDFDLREMIVMGHDWGGPIGMAVAAAQADRVHGLVLANTWFWRADDLSSRIFSGVMSSPPLQGRSSSATPSSSGSFPAASARAERVQNRPKPVRDRSIITSSGSLRAPNQDRGGLP